MKISKRQLKRLIREWFSDEHDPVTGERDQSAHAKDAYLDSTPAYEDNQTKMVRRYLALRGEESKLDTMSQQEIEILAAELRSYPPSTKKRWGIYDLRENKMKITKRQLKRIIKEEKRRILRENYDQGYNDWLNGAPEPQIPYDPDYMNGWEDAELDSQVGGMDVGDYE